VEREKICLVCPPDVIASSLSRSAPGAVFKFNARAKKFIATSYMNPRERASERVPKKSKVTYILIIFYIHAQKIETFHTIENSPQFITINIISSLVLEEIFIQFSRFSVPLT
jgi:hypothetical protein